MRKNVETTEKDDEQSTFVDPSYTFSFRTPDYQRREDADSLGRVRGLYSFIDDVGEKHLVRYAASADRGFEVLNSVPDASRYVQYSAPLYKTSPKVRGRVAYERGPGRQYKFISSGPDQRRMETTGNDGITRGAYSYLDDKGVQRTTQYIAGPGIGYRIVQATTGPGTHLLPRPSSVEFGILYPPANNDRSDRKGNRGPPGTGSENRDNDGTDSGTSGTGATGGSGIGGNSSPDGDDDFGSFDGSNDSGNGGAGAVAGGGGGSIDAENNGSGGNKKEGNRPETNRPAGNRPGGNRNNDSGFSGGENSNGKDINSDEDERYPDNNIGNDRPNVKGGREYLIINNRGKSYFGIPAGKSARAHVQNIDLIPYGEAASISPSERLRQDENAARYRSNRRRYRGWNRIVD